MEFYRKSCSLIENLELLSDCPIPLRHRNMSPQQPASRHQGPSFPWGLDGDWAGAGFDTFTVIIDSESNRILSQVCFLRAYSVTTAVPYACILSNLKPTIAFAPIFLAFLIRFSLALFCSSRTK